MGLEDFEGQSRLKFVIPFVYVMSWLSMVLGPFYFPVCYNQYCMIILMYLAVRGVVLCILNLKLVLSYHEISKARQKQDQLFVRNSFSLPINHAFVIPSYNEDIELLNETLTFLSRHKKATQSYLIFLAMEKHEPESQQKAKQLIHKFRSDFLRITYTLHQLTENQHKGKASNVNYCASNMHITFEELNLNEECIFLTIMDSDSWAPQFYVNEVEKHIAKNFENRHQFIYQPPQIYMRNNLEVNALIRAYDNMHGSMHASNLSSFSGVSFSLSNYTLSYKLAKSVGFWDTVEEAIGEDMHMCLKTIFKTEGKASTVPVFVPFNQLNIQTGHGIISDIKSKFWQIERHARGVADVSYCINMLMKTKLTFKTLWASFLTIQTFFLPCVTPWVMLSVFFQQFLSEEYLMRSQLRFSLESQVMCINLMNIGIFTATMIYEVFKRRSMKDIYNIENESLFRIFEGVLLHSINIAFITVPAFVVGSFGNLMTNREYIVTEKNTKRLLKSGIKIGNDKI